MIWSAPWAWALAALAALPVAAHLWSRKQPRTMAFPTLRFLRAASPVSRRLHRVHEWPLLLLRLAIVLAICAAAAGPTLTTSWREATWRSRLHRVIVIDQDVPAAERKRVVADLRRSVSSAAIIGPGAVTDLLDAAIGEASRAARAMRAEVVIVWTGDGAALTARDVADLPARVGLRLVPVGSPVASLRGDHPAVAPSVVIEAEQDDRAARASERRMRQRLRLPRSAAATLVRWPGPRRDVPAAAETDSAARPAAAAVARALADIASDPRVRDAADRSIVARAEPASGRDPSRGRRLATSLDDTALLRGWVEDDRLVLELDAAGTSPLGWWSVVAAAESLARFDRFGPAEQWQAQDLARVQREAPKPDVSDLPGGLDTRATWACALVLLLCEQMVRRGRTSRGASDAA